MDATLLVIENYYKGPRTFIMDDGIYAVGLEDSESDEERFTEAIMTDSVFQDFDLVESGTISIPFYKAVRR